jgi:putative FmdB family regulatory protein
MPVYEYRCNSCGRRFSRLVGVIAQSSGPECPHCGAVSARKLVSRFARGRSEDEMLERITDPASVGDPDDPASVKRWMGEMGKEMGEDFGDELDEILESDEADKAIDLDKED